MQKTYGKDGMVALSVQIGSLDDPEDKAKYFKALKDAKVTDLKTVVLNEKEEVWKKKLGYESFPAVYVFNREGKWTRFRSDDKEYSDTEVMLNAVDRLVKTLLKK
jgi:hypothetical protein